ncbi:MAG: hypothetical protein R3F11_07345 [Verrucomicrobiales bacterium]
MYSRVSPLPAVLFAVARIGGGGGGGGIGFRRIGCRSFLRLFGGDGLGGGGGGGGRGTGVSDRGVRILAPEDEGEADDDEHEGDRRAEDRVNDVHD